MPQTTHLTASCAPFSVSEKAAVLQAAAAAQARRKWDEAEAILVEAKKRDPDFVDAAQALDSLRFARALPYDVVRKRRAEVLFHFNSLKNKTLRADEIDKVRLQGWFQISDPATEVVVKEKGRPARNVAFTRSRPDVVARLREKGITDQRDLCGFSCDIDLTGPVTLSLSGPDGIVPVVTLSATPRLQVIVGKEGWLFLDKDRNRSPDLFSGALQLTSAEREAWARFAAQTAKGMARRGIGFAMVIAPAKEDVLPEYYPAVPAAHALVDIVTTRIAMEGVAVSCPIRRLRQNADSYYATDTHWSSAGAWICIQDVLAQLGLDTGDYSPGFVDRETAGDLGSKMSPPQIAIRKAFVPQTGRIVFANRSGHAGDITIWRNAQPVLPQKVLVFGGSSSAQMAEIMGDVFAEVTRINTPAIMPIWSIVDHVRPDIVICQTNGRYLRTVPRAAVDSFATPLAALGAGQLPEGWPRPKVLRPRSLVQGLKALGEKINRRRRDRG